MLRVVAWSVSFWGWSGGRKCWLERRAEDLEKKAKGAGSLVCKSDPQDLHHGWPRTWLEVLLPQPFVGNKQGGGGGCCAFGLERRAESMLVVGAVGGGLKEKKRR